MQIIIGANVENKNMNQKTRIESWHIVKLWYPSGNKSNAEDDFHWEQKCKRQSSSSTQTQNMSIYIYIYNSSLENVNLIQRIKKKNLILSMKRQTDLKIRLFQSLRVNEQNCSLTNCPKSIRRATTTHNHPIDTSKFKRLNWTQFVIKKDKPEILKYV